MGPNAPVEDAAAEIEDVTVAPIVKKPKRVKAKPETAAADVEEPIRARDEEGKFLADDPATPENEAWVEPEREN